MILTLLIVGAILFAVSFAPMRHPGPTICRVAGIACLAIGLVLLIVALVPTRADDPYDNPHAAPVSRNTARSLTTLRP